MTMPIMMTMPIVMTMPIMMTMTTMMMEKQVKSKLIHDSPPVG